MTSTPSWIVNSDGKQPYVRWSFTTDTPLKYLCLARETGEVLVADEAGKIYLISRQGKLLSAAGGFKLLNGLVFSDNGETAVAMLGDSKIVWINRRGGIVGTKSFSSDVLSIAIDPYGNIIAVTLNDGTTSFYQGKRDRIANFNTDRPLNFLKFLASEPLLLGASEYGMLSLHNLQGDELWKENFSTNVGDMAAYDDGSQIYVAGYNLGVQRYDSNGESDGNLMVEGNPKIVATSYQANRIAITTLENNIYWLDPKGKLIWEAALPAEVCNICVDPLGEWLICGLTTGKTYRLDWRNRKM